ncbi:PAS domain-containing protein [Anatilimnocola floriformis]|uniref:PAS domain-containing protein n=1 Tax=Anatilimnocola floriformis TaxID=2948575 RepID=UPI0020C3AD00|nr:PAS domain-containing protein [Anatilimnocola floriformis]
MPTFFEVSRDLHSLAGLDGCFKQVNPSFTRVLGYRKSEFFAQPYVEFVFSQHAPKFLTGQTANLRRRGE